MDRKGLICGAIIALLVLAVPAWAAITSGRPKAGRWKIEGGGGFVVSKNRKSVSGFILKHPQCITGPVKVIGKHKLSTATRGGYKNWIIGRNTPKTSSGVTPIKVKFKQGGKTMVARLDIIFGVAGDPKSNSGDLTVNGCDSSFFAEHR